MHLRGSRSRGSNLVDTLCSSTRRGFDSLIERLVRRGDYILALFPYVVGHLLWLGLEWIRKPGLDYIEPLVCEIVCPDEERGKTNLNRLGEIISGVSDCLGDVVWRASEKALLENGIYLID
jgi:hypothetical protein